jgi:hypothetical protein
VIIDRFGTTYATAYVFPRAQEVDTWRAERPAISARVSGLPGAFDYWGDNNFPWSPITLRKSFILTDTTSSSSSLGSGTGIHFNSGSTFVTGTGTNWLTSLQVGDVISVPSVGLTRTVATIWNNTQIDVTQNAPFTDTYATYYILHTTSGSLDILVNALKAATIDYAYEAKLFMLRNDGATGYAWAKCTGLKISEQAGQIHFIQAEVEFYSREGISLIY